MRRLRRLLADLLKAAFLAAIQEAIRHSWTSLHDCSPLMLAHTHYWQAIKAAFILAS